MSRSLSLALVIHLLVCVCYCPVMAQGGTGKADTLASKMLDSAGVAKARVDYAVPDAPAMKMLDIDPSNLMRPSTVREVALAVSAINAKGGAVEFSPTLLTNPTLTQYKERPFWYRLRLSGGAKTSDDGTKSYGIGLRMTFVDEADLRTDQALQQDLLEIGHQLGRKELECSNAITIDPVDHPEEYGRAFDSCLDMPKFIARADSMVGGARERAKERNWNKALWEMGIAALASTNDSLVRHLRAEKYGLWSTLALPIFSTRGQILIGVKGLVERDSANSLSDWDGSMAIRGYAGRNNMKGYVELDYEGKTHQFPSVDAYLGMELSFGNGIWVDGSIGIVAKEGEGAKLASSFNFRFGTPESPLK